MKQVIVIIRPEKWLVTREVFVSLGIDGVVQHRVLGRGLQRGLRYLRRSSESTEGDMPFLPKRLVVSYVPDDRLDALIGALIKANQTGNYGDGKIFILPVDSELLENIENDRANVAPTR